MPEEHRPTKNTDELLAGLNHSDPTKRIEVIKSLDSSDIQDQRIISELRLTANGDPDPRVQSAAKATLKSFGLSSLAPRKFSSDDTSKNDFRFGVALWFILNLVLFFCSASQFASSRPSLGYMPLFINIGLFIYFSFTRRQVAYGMLAGFGSLLVITLCLGVVLMAVCFLPGIVA
jgi:hypothetical protein